MSYQLKIKYLSLAAEARIIRRFESAKRRHIANAKTDEQRAEHVSTLSNLRDHRKNIVGAVARDTHLARMFLKGTPYKAAEQDAKTKPRWKAVWDMAKRYGPHGANYTASKHNEDAFKAWAGLVDDGVKTP